MVNNKTLVPIKVRQSGGSIAVTIPPVIAKNADIKLGDFVNLELVNNQLIFVKC